MCKLFQQTRYTYHPVCFSLIWFSTCRFQQKTFFSKIQHFSSFQLINRIIQTISVYICRSVLATYRCCLLSLLITPQTCAKGKAIVFVYRRRCLVFTFVFFKMLGNVNELYKLCISIGNSYLNQKNRNCCFIYFFQGQLKSTLKIQYTITTLHVLAHTSVSQLLQLIVLQRTFFRSVH